ncbi:MAG: hypothetical protein JSW27_14290 [Phycisphaerales bacterium]|nr:MAG: hypothetical protein JSW27_14290 [Phycisphaerales bacterium]
MLLGKYSFGIGDRFGHQGKAQLAGLIKARAAGAEITPVWNKSHREHSIIGTAPGDVRYEADAAVAACGWNGPYFVDADHIGISNVDAFVEASDFFTLDVADFIGRPAEAEAVDAFAARHELLMETLEIDGIAEPFDVQTSELRAIASKYLAAVQEAGRIYRHIADRKGAGTFVTEVSMDETDAPQTPVEMLIILAAIADEGIPAQTVAPKFSGRFNKGVDYVGSVEGFSQEFQQDLAVIAYAVEKLGLPADLKLSVHSGSDKFSIYRPIRAALRKFDAGVHLKTAGTTWLEELIGLASAGGEGLGIAQEVYATALGRMDELCGPYASVIDIDRGQLPSADEVASWDGETFASALRHDQSAASYNASLRQLLHVGYKVAAEMGPRFLDALQAYEETIAEHVTANIYERHIRPLFLGSR